MNREELLASFGKLRQWSSGESRAPHKPLLVLYALGELSRGNKSLRYEDTRAPLTELLRDYGPARSTDHPEQPFWRLQNDGVWNVSGKTKIAMGADGGATNKSLLYAEAEGRFEDDIRATLLAHPQLISELAREILAAHFPISVHDDLLNAVGLDVSDASAAGGGRDPTFRKRVLTAYGHQCAVCGMQLLLSGSSVALEAAHIKWHQAGGPATVTNGLCLCVLHHKLFDRGAFTIAAPTMVLVSDEIAGLAGLNEHLLAHHGQSLRSPIRSDDVPTAAFLHWHRREVFRGEARPF